MKNCIPQGMCLEARENGAYMNGWPPPQPKVKSAVAVPVSQELPPLEDDAVIHNAGPNAVGAVPGERQTGAVINNAATVINNGLRPLYGDGDRETVVLVVKRDRQKGIEAQRRYRMRVKAEIESGVRDKDGTRVKP